MDLTLNTYQIRNMAQIYPFYVCFALIYWDFFFYSKTFGYFCKAIYGLYANHKSCKLTDCRT